MNLGFQKQYFKKLETLCINKNHISYNNWVMLSISLDPVLYQVREEKYINSQYQLIGIMKINGWLSIGQDAALMDNALLLSLQPENVWKDWVKFPIFLNP